MFFSRPVLAVAATATDGVHGSAPDSNHTHLCICICICICICTPRSITCRCGRGAWTCTTTASSGATTKPARYVSPYAVMTGIARPTPTKSSHPFFTSHPNPHLHPYPCPRAPVSVSAAVQISLEEPGIHNYLPKSFKIPPVPDKLPPWEQETDKEEEVKKARPWGHTLMHTPHPRRDRRSSLSLISLSLISLRFPSSVVRTHAGA